MKTCDLSIGVLEAISRRRAVRRYTQDDVSSEIVKQLLVAATQAPSTLNQQPWAFAVFQGKRRLHHYSDCAKRYLIEILPPSFTFSSRSELYCDAGYELFHGGNTLIVIYGKRGQLNTNEECCLAAENLMLAACGLGLATCPVGFARGWFDLHATKTKFGIPENYHAVFPVVVGYASGETPPTAREDPEIVCWRSKEGETDIE